MCIKINIATFVCLEQYQYTLVHTIVSQINIHGHLNVACYFGLHECLLEYAHVNCMCFYWSSYIDPLKKIGTYPGVGTYV